MQLKHLIEPILNQLAESLKLLTQEQYAKKCGALNGSTIGGHTRHVIELYQCLLNGYNTGIVNYEKRKRDLAIETNNKIACELLNGITQAINKENKYLQLEGCFTSITDEEYSISTNYYREVVYNLEHTIHHMALIRVGINALGNITLPEDFGVAPSTIKHKQLCVQ
jgi:hypothetical protein